MKLNMVIERIVQAGERGAMGSEINKQLLGAMNNYEKKKTKEESMSSAIAEAFKKKTKSVDDILKPKDLEKESRIEEARAMVEKMRVNGKLSNDSLMVKGNQNGK